MKIKGIGAVRVYHVGSDDVRYTMEWRPPNRSHSRAVVRFAQLTDAERIWHVRVKSICELCANDYSPEQLQGWVGKATPERYREIIANGKEAVVVADVWPAGVVGYASLFGAEVYAVHVDPGFARRGIGSQLLAAIEVEAIANGLTALMVDASITAVPFYQSQGYEVLRHTHHQLRSGVQIPCVRMRKGLRQC